MEQIISNGVIVIGVLVALTNVITEVAKLNFKFLKDADAINMFATITAIILTTLTGLAYAQINMIALTWYHIVALIVVGFMVALASMQGFDKLWKYFESFKGEF